jgi:hypothetical protein
VLSIRCVFLNSYDFFVREEDSTSGLGEKVAKRGEAFDKEIGAPASGMIAIGSPDAPEQDLESGTWTDRNASPLFVFTAEW